MRILFIWLAGLDVNGYVKVIFKFVTAVETQPTITKILMIENWVGLIQTLVSEKQTGL